MKSDRNNKKNYSSFFRSLLLGPVPKNPLYTHQTLFIHQSSGLSCVILFILSVIALSRSNWTDSLNLASTATICLGIFVLNYVYQNKAYGILVLFSLLVCSTIGLFSGPNMTRLGALFTSISIVILSALILTKRIFYIMFTFSFIILTISLILAVQGKLGVRLGVNLSEHQVFGVLSSIIVIGIVAEGAANSIRESEEKFRNIFYDSADPVLLSDGKGFFDCNQAAIAVLGIESTQDLVGKLPWEISPPFQRDGFPSREKGEVITKKIVDGNLSQFEWTFQRADKTPFDVEVSISRSTVNKKPIFISIWRDVTQRRIIETEEFKRRSEFMRMERLYQMGEFTATLAHELNQPLTAMLTNAQRGLLTIDTGQADINELKDLLEDIARDNKRAGDIIKSLKDRIKPGEAHLETFSINDVLREVVSLLKGEAAVRNIRIELDLSPLSPTVLADKIQIQQVLINLIMNAAEAMEAITDNKRIVVASHGGDGMHVDLVDVSIRDFGHGIPEEHLHSIFEPYFSTKAKGMGVGLTLVRSIIEAHGGTIKAKNNIHQGATFSFTLPRGDGQDEKRRRVTGP